MRFHTITQGYLKLAVITTCPGTFSEKLKHLDLINDEYIKKDGKNLKFFVKLAHFP